MAGPRPLMFHALADHFDAFIAGKDSRAECQLLERLARRLGRSGGRSWLDVACGTGRHLEFLRRHYVVTGLDISEDMLRIARRRLPGTRLLRADMRTFRLHDSFDVVSCLYSAIGHLKTERDLEATIANFARHLKHGGVVIIEPWIDPLAFRAGFVHLVSHTSPAATVVRMSSSSRRGARSVIQYHYLIGETNRGIKHFAERDVGLLVSRTRVLAIMRKAGLTSRFLRRGLTPGRGLFVGVLDSRPPPPL